MNTPTQPRTSLLSAVFDDPYTGGTLTLRVTPSGDTRWRATVLVEAPGREPRVVTCPRVRDNEITDALKALSFFVSTAETAHHISPTTAQTAINLLTLTAINHPQQLQP